MLVTREKRPHNYLGPIFVRCSYCGKFKAISRRKFRKDKDWFCDLKCKGKWYSENCSSWNNPNYKQIETYCATCGKKILVPQSKFKKNKNCFCNRDCFNKFQRNKNTKKITVKCFICGKSFLVSKYNAKKSEKHFCCTEHKNEWMKSVKGDQHWLAKREQRKCKYCGKEFTVRPSEKNKYCSLKCYQRDRFGIEEKHCKVCGKPLKGRRSLIYCSRKCMGLDRHNRIEKICPICGKSFFRRPCEEKGERNVCSKECADILKKGDYRIPDETLEKYLIELKNRLGRIPNLTDLKNETNDNPNAVHWALYVRRGGLRYWQKKLFGEVTYWFAWETTCIDKFNEVLGFPEFQTQKTFKWLKHFKPNLKRPGSLRVDLFYPKYKLCIEFDGEGHFQEINWQKGKQESLEDIKERDNIKNILIPAHGLKLLRFRYNEPLTEEHILERLAEVGVYPEQMENAKTKIS